MKLNRFEVVSGKCIKEISVQSRIGYSMSDTTDFYDMDEWLKKGECQGATISFYDYGFIREAKDSSQREQPLVGVRLCREFQSEVP